MSKKSVGKTVDAMTPGEYLRWMASTLDKSHVAVCLEQAKRADALYAACEKVTEHYANMSGNPNSPVPDKHWIEGALMARSAIGKFKGGAA